MRQLPIPRNVPSDMQRVVQEANRNFKRLDIPILKSMASVRGIEEGTSCYYRKGKKLYRYTKVAGILYEELVGTDVGLDENQVKAIADEAVENAPHTTPEEAEEIADDVVANAPRATLTGGTLKDSIMEGEVREELLTYDVGNPPPTRFARQYFTSYQDVVAEKPIPETEIPNYVTNEIWTPVTPRQEEGLYHAIFSFVPIRSGRLLVNLGSE